MKPEQIEEALTELEAMIERGEGGKLKLTDVNTVKKRLPWNGRTLVPAAPAVIAPAPTDEPKKTYEARPTDWYVVVALLVLALALIWDKLL